MRPRGTRTYLFVSVTLAISCCAVVSSAQTAQTALKPDQVTEFIDPQERISGENPVGVVTHLADDSVEPEKLYVYAPRPSTINVFINSVDGRYSYEGVYTVKAVEGEPFDWIHIELKSDRHDFIRDYELDELAILVRSDKSDRVYPARWGGDDMGSELSLYVNSERAKAYFGKRLCSPPSKHFGFKFNYVCTVPVSSVSETGAISIRRKHGVRRLDAIPIRVSLPK